MTLHIFGSNSIGPGTRVDLQITDEAFVSQGVTVASTDGRAIIGDGSFHVVEVAGTVFGDYSAIWLGNDSAVDSFQRVLIGQNAYVGSTGYTVALQGQNSTAVNRGMVSGLIGFFMGGVGDDQSNLTNFGTITGELDAILRIEGSTERLVIANHGAIICGAYGPDNYALDSNFSNAQEVLRNRGVVVGDVDFGLGDDIYDGRGGMIEGTVFGRAGKDVFFAGETIESFDGGAGIDTLNLRSSAGGRVDLSGAGSGTGVARGDSYVDVEIVLGSNSGADVVIGSSADNTLSGFGGADALDGRAGRDVLEGGGEADTLTGGAGNDRFQFRELTDAGDVITDFSGVVANNDQFRISAAGFGGGLVAGALAASQFQARADTLAQDADDRFIFRTTDATLWFDVNGSAAGGLTLVADLQAGAVVTAGDIILF
jgi:Ca2+-binding RTX toxin-like protein